MEKNRPSGNSIRIYLVDGDPEGFRWIEKSNWTGQGLICPRSRYTAVRQREQFGRPGVYLLTGPGESPDSVHLYIGEAENLRTRIDQHIGSKAFWTVVTAFISKDQSLNKVGVKYLESRLCHKAQQAGRAQLENGNAPAEPVMSEPDQAEMEGFLTEMLVVFPLAGISAFRVAAGKPDDDGTTFYILRNQLQASGAPDGSGFAVYAGSQASGVEAPAIPPETSHLRAQLLANGVLAYSGSSLEFVKSFVFNSSSAAAQTILGYAASGPREWKNKTRVTLSAFEKSLIQSSP